MADEQAALLAEIAKLSGAISQHRHAPQPAPHYPRGRGGASFRGAARGRGSHTYAPRGRGAPLPSRHRTLILNDSTKKAQQEQQQADSSADQSESASPVPSSSAAASADANTASSQQAVASSSKLPATNVVQSTDGWIKRRTTHNMSLVSSSTFEKTEPARLAALAAGQSARAVAKASRGRGPSTPKGLIHKSSSKGKAKEGGGSVRRGDRMGEVVIDGVVFEFDPTGTKLVKKVSPPSPSPSSATADAPSTPTTEQKNLTSPTSTPLRTSVNGQAYVRTKGGNLISAALLAKRRAQKEMAAKMRRLGAMGTAVGEMQAARYAGRKGNKSLTTNKKVEKQLCSFFTKTGQCKRGLSCPFIHDPIKLAICPRSLRPGGCPAPADTCPLSHTPTPQRMPHCVHFLRLGTCRAGDACVYTHASLSPDAKICRDFADRGWCDKGAECDHRHTWECPDFVEKGECKRKGCRLLHVLRSRGDGATGGGSEGAGATQSSAQNGAGDNDADFAALQDGDLFMRDDAAATRSSHVKRKRALLDGEEGGEEEDDDGKEEEEEESVAILPKKRRRARGPEFVKQLDYVPFGGDDDEDDEEDEEDEEDDEEDEEGEGQGEIDSSVASDDSGDELGRDDGDGDGDEDGAEDGSEAEEQDQEREGEVGAGEEEESSDEDEDLVEQGL